VSGLSLRAAVEQDATAIQDIYNHYVHTSTCTYQLEPDELVDTQAWLHAHDPAVHPILVAEIDGVVVGWGALSPHRARGGYRHAVEDSVYVHAERQGRGIGSALLGQLIERARGIGHHTILAGIDAEHEASVRLHERAGFVKVGHLREVGFKLGRWLDVIYMQLLLG
jgi:phosphinothricin acetyltransferase